MRTGNILLWAALAMPGIALADSCGTAITVVNHRASPIVMTMKSFYMDRELEPPAPDDFAAPVIRREVPTFFSGLVTIKIAAGHSTRIPFRRLCTGDFWLNWRAVGTPGGTASSGQLRPHYDQLLEIR